MKSPFDDLQIGADLVCHFFASFARFEYAMKATQYGRADRFGNAVADWNALKSELGKVIEPTLTGSAREAIDYLLAEPPQVQKFIDGQATFQAVPLSGDNLGAKAISAAKRVRNNLFHGGKHTPHSSPDRDTKLIEAALAVLEACICVDPSLRIEFEEQLA